MQFGVFLESYLRKNELKVTIKIRILKSNIVFVERSDKVPPGLHLCSSSILYTEEEMFSILSNSSIPIMQRVIIPIMHCVIIPIMHCEE